MFSGKRLWLHISVFLFITLESLGQPGGFLDRKHEISFDFTELIQLKANVEYKYCFRKHCALWLNAGQQFYKGPLVMEETDEQGDLIPYGRATGKSSEIGIGLLFNTSYTGAVLPLGNYFGISYVKDFSPGYTEIVDSTGSEYHYSSEGYSIRWVIGREIYIARNFVFDYNLVMGVVMGRIKYLNGTERDPDIVLPFNSIFSFNEYNFTSLSSKTYNAFHCIPNLKIGYLF